MWEWLALLLPVAAASGWYAAKRADAGDRRAERVRALNSSYTRGLEYMLQDRVDEALALLSDTTSGDAEGHELRLAIGNFFRRRGEVDKALAVHQALLTTAHLPESLRCKVQFELGMDYYAAGLLDRAEDAFRSLQDKRGFAEKSLDNLLKIYQREKDWEQAIACLRQLRRIGRPSHRETIAQFYCELALQHASRGHDDEAIRLVRAALRDDPQCARAHILLARSLARRRAWPEVRAILGALERRAPDLLPDVLDLAVELYSHEKDEQGLRAWLQHLHETHGCVAAASLLSSRLTAGDGGAAARTYLIAALARTPSMPLLQVLLEHMVPTDRNGGYASIEPAILSVLRAVVPPVTQRYTCSQCGFSGTEMHWRCPSCQTWETITPTRE